MDLLIIMPLHYNDVIMGTIASQITSLRIAFSTAYLDTDQRKHQSSASLAIVRGIHRRPVNSLQKGPVTGIMFPFDDIIMKMVESTSNQCIPLPKTSDVEVWFFFVINLSKMWNKQCSCWWFYMLWCSYDIIVTKTAFVVHKHGGTNQA